MYAKSYKDLMVMIIAEDLYPTFNYKPAEQLLEEVQKILVTFIRKLNAKR